MGSTSTLYGFKTFREMCTTSVAPVAGDTVIQHTLSKP